MLTISLLIKRTNSRLKVGEVSRGEKMTLRGAHSKSYITEYNLVYEGYTWVGLRGAVRGLAAVRGLCDVHFVDRH